MTDSPHSLGGSTPPIRGLAHRLSYVGLVLAVFALMILGKADAVLMETLRAHVVDAVAPIADALSRPIDGISHLVDEVKGLWSLREENAQLREDRDRLLQWQATARRLEAENRSLRTLLNYQPGPEASFITARVIATSKGDFVNTIVVNAGERNGVRKGQAVVSGDGLVGRVHAVSTNSALVLLITDRNSRIPVRVETTRIRAVFAGDNEQSPILDHLPPGSVVSPGDRLVTSGDGGAFPAGIPVGVVTSVSEKRVLAEPMIDLHRLEYIRLVDYGLDGILQLPPSGTAKRKNVQP